MLIDEEYVSDLPTVSYLLGNEGHIVSILMISMKDSNIAF